MSTAPEAQKPAKGAKADAKAPPKVTAKSKAKAEAAASEKARFGRTRVNGPAPRIP